MPKPPAAANPKPARPEGAAESGSTRSSPRPVLIVGRARRTPYFTMSSPSPVFTVTGPVTPSSVTTSAPSPVSTANEEKSVKSALGEPETCTDVAPRVSMSLPEPVWSSRMSSSAPPSSV